MRGQSTTVRGKTPSSPPSPPSFAGPAADAEALSRAAVRLAVALDRRERPEVGGERRVAEAILEVQVDDAALVDRQLRELGDVGRLDRRLAGQAEHARERRVGKLDQLRRPAGSTFELDAVADEARVWPAVER